MLPSKELNFRFILSSPGRVRRQYQPASGFEDALMVELQLDSYSAFQTLGFRDPSDGNEGRFRMTDEATPKSQA